MVLALLACTLTFAATQIQVGDLWFELGKTYATVIADMSGSKTNYATLTEANIPASVTYNNYEYVRHVDRSQYPCQRDVQ